MATTRMSDHEKQDAAHDAAAHYRNSARTVYEMQANYPAPEFKCHAPFDGRYLDNTVWESIARRIGPVRADRVTQRAFEQIRALALTHHLKAVQDGYCTADGLAARLAWDVKYQDGFGRQQTIRRDDWQAAQWTAATLRDVRFKCVRVRAVAREDRRAMAADVPNLTKEERDSGWRTVCIKGKVWIKLVGVTTGGALAGSPTAYCDHKGEKVWLAPAPADDPVDFVDVIE